MATETTPAAPMKIALRAIRDLPMPEQDNMLSANMRGIARFALEVYAANEPIAEQRRKAAAKLISESFVKALDYIEADPACAVHVDHIERLIKWAQDGEPMSTGEPT